MAATFGRRETFGLRAPLRNTATATGVSSTPAFPPPAPDIAIRPKWPLLTLAIAAALVAMFLAEQIFRVEPASVLANGLRNDIALGGVDAYFVLHDKEWWRLFTAPWLHAGVDHLVGNLIPLVIGGALLERLIGRAWLAALYFAGALAGSLASILFNGPHIVSVGASGAIMSVITALFALSFHVEAGKQAGRLRRAALVIIIPAVAPSAAHGASQIDIGCHFGGIIAGLAVGFVLLAIWSENQKAPPLGRSIAGVATAGALGTILSFALVAQHYPLYAARTAELVPLNAFESDNVLQKVGDYVRRYPHDPALRLIMGLQAMQAHYYRDAEDQLRAGLAEQQALATEFAPAVGERLQAMLAMTLVEENRLDDARKAAAPICGIAGTDPVLAKAYEVLRNAGACD